MKPVVRSDFARLAFPFQEKTNTTRHPGLSVPGFEISVPGFEISIPGFENPIAGYEISVPGIVFVQAGIASSCKLTLEFHKKFEQRAPCIQQGNAAIAANVRSIVMHTLFRTYFLGKHTLFRTYFSYRHTLFRR